MNVGQRPDLSVIIPAKNEAENLPDLLSEIEDALRADLAFEVLVVDDGSDDHTEAVVRDHMAERPWLRLIKHDRSAGKSAAVRSGAFAATGEFVVTLDGDGQNNPADVPRMIEILKEPNTRVALVAAERVGRTDTVIKKLASRFANSLRSAVLHDKTRDTANGLKAMRRDAYLRLPFFDTMHRFFPALIVREGFEVGHIDVVDRPRRHGQSKYGILDRALVSIGDMVGLFWLIRRRKIIPAVEIVEPEPKPVGSEND
ncbi:MAG: glycosyltransferase family 2 protein [Pseudomonadota bacterium]